MEELFALPEGEWLRIRPSLARLRRLVLVVVLGLVLLVLVLAGFVVSEARLVAWPLGGVGLLFGGWMWWLIGRNVRNWGYAERAEDLWIRHGAFVMRLVVVPYGRMQLVDINRGPIARAFGLSELKLVTAAAASHITIPGLPEADAETLRDRLVELAESRRAGL